MSPTMNASASSAASSWCTHGPNSVTSRAARFSLATDRPARPRDEGTAGQRHRDRIHDMEGQYPLGLLVAETEVGPAPVALPDERRREEGRLANERPSLTQVPRSDNRVSGDRP